MLTPKGTALKSSVVARRRALMEACLADLDPDPSVIDALASIVHRLISLA